MSRARRDLENRRNNGKKGGKGGMQREREVTIVNRRDANGEARSRIVLQHNRSSDREEDRNMTAGWNSSVNRR